jgi:hypothetical protein
MRVACRPTFRAVLVCLGCLPGVSVAQAETMKVTTLYTAAINPANGVHPLWTPVQHYRGKTFVVAPDVNLRPMVTQIDANGKITTVPLDANPDYTASSDGHNRFTLGIDKDGYLHVTGDMHGYAWWATTYVARYQRQNMMYWRSNKPLDVTGGFTFAGGLNSATALPGEEWGGDSRFFNDRNGELYFSSRVRAFTGGRLSGSEPFIAYGVYRYDTATGLWTALGGVASEAETGARNFNTVLYWEHTTSFEAYQCAPRFDNSNRLHFALAGNTAGTQGQGLIYAVSDDGGIHWKKASGDAIPGLPLRGKDGEPNQGDLIVRSGRVAQQSHIAIDKDGRVAVHGDGTWRTWNGTAWTPITGGTGILGPDNVLTSDGGSTLNRTPAVGQPAVSHDTGFGQVFSISELGLQVENAVYAVGLPPKTNFVHATQMSVFKATFAPDDNVATTGRASTKPAAPRIFFAQGENQRVWLSWTTPAGAASYNVKRAIAKAGPYAAIAKGVTKPGEFTDTGCVNGTPCFYVVSAVNSAGEGPDSAAVSVTPQRQTPRPPIIQTALGRNARITLNWLPLWPDATSYNIKRASDKGGPYVTIAKGVEGLHYTDAGLVNDKPYYYVVSATNPIDGESADSRPVSAAPFRWIPILKYKSIGYDDKGTASASAENPPREMAAQAFDGVLSSKWLMPANAGWLQYRFAPGESYAVTRYKLTSGQDAPSRDPADWQFQGSADGKTWVTLDTQTHQTFAGRSETHTYSFDNRTAYPCYRLNITKNQGDGLTQVAELQLWIDDAVIESHAGHSGGRTPSR